MAQTKINFQTKKELKKAVESGTVVTLKYNYPFMPKQEGTEFVEGPHGVPAKWYAQVTLQNGRIVKVH